MSSDAATADSDKYIGLALAFASSFLIGSSIVITKLGHMDVAQKSNEKSGAKPSYTSSWKWWAGMITMGLGEAANFAAYSFAPAILVTPIGAMSVLIGAVLASVILNERLGRDGFIGCALCFLGSPVIVLHAPSELVITGMDQMLVYFTHPGFLVYVSLVMITCLFLIFKVAPKHGNSNILVYLVICSLIGSISVMAVKAFGLAIRLTIEGNNQFNNPVTYLFGFVMASAAVTQIIYFNKSLSAFSTNVVNPVYYVLFTSATIIASIILFQGMKDTNSAAGISILCGFGTIFTGVFMLNSKNSPSKQIRFDDEENHLLRTRKRSVAVSNFSVGTPSSNQEDLFVKVRSDEELHSYLMKSTESP